ncbi:hypothetical protein PPTG_12290 [Phytophthora nicotianae INRA-310]|uniref:Elicitin n=1 Tax=Phytophthora nicotianae (strain INRA-310) TaxID=761204 RepID=W2Q7I4_PHYN3|nr:hypothetical protein PPTG_12290 [Phytophthora nicotianae INRA-310]ETN08519.1 hypothetical protein PPTG_12290 [Phytophthora nicotianae INRA-310]
MPLHHRFAFFLCCIAALAFISVTDAADCTSTEIAELSTLSSNVTAVCGSDALSSSMSTTTYCADSSCLAFLTSIVSSVPSCELESYNLRTVLTTAIRSCDAASDAVPASRSSSQSLHRTPQWTASNLLVRGLQAAVVLVIASGVL